MFILENEEIDIQIWFSFITINISKKKNLRQQKKRLGTPAPSNFSTYEVKQKAWFFPLHDIVEVHLEHAKILEPVSSMHWTRQIRVLVPVDLKIIKKFKPY